MVAGGYDAAFLTTENIEMCDMSTRKWKKIDLLSFARVEAIATSINNNSIIVIGGCTSAVILCQAV